MKPRQINTDMWLVVHIPKVAGTSFRWSLEKYFGHSKVIRDYGPQAEATTKVVREHLYSGDKSKNKETLVKAIGCGHARILVGHFPLEKYVKYFEPGKIIAFIREPLVRTCSEYLHRLNNGTFEGSFTKFFQRPGYQNTQVRLLKDIPGEAFIGVAEMYGESLRRINSATKWKLTNRKKNVGRQGGGQSFSESLSFQELELFNKLNQKDLDFYRESVQKFETIAAQTEKASRLLSWLKTR